MNLSPFNDRRTASLLSKVSDDLSHLRDDVGDLISHTTRRTLPKGAKDLADSARQGLAAGVSQLRSLRGHHPSPCTTGWVGGALLVGLLAVGVYALCKHRGSGNYEDEY